LFVINTFNELQTPDQDQYHIFMGVYLGYWYISSDS